MARTDLPIIEQRRIEAAIIKPIYEELRAELGEREAKRIIGAAIRRDAVAQGKAYAGSGSTSLAGFHALFPLWTANGALEVEVHEESETDLRYNVTRCRYAEMYQKMGLAEIGDVLSCGRDATFCTGYDSRIRLARTQTIMQGASHCDFHYQWVDEGGERSSNSDRDLRRSSPPIPADTSGGSVE